MIPSRRTPVPSQASAWQRTLLGFPGICLAMLWGFAEATFFFLIPDVFLSLVAVLRWLVHGSTSSARSLAQR